VTQQTDRPVSVAAEAAAATSRNFLLILWRRKALVLAGTAVGLVIAGLVYAQSTPVYQASAQVLVVKKGGNVVPLEGGDPRAVYMEDYLTTHLLLIKSQLIVERAVKKRDLGRLPSLQGKGDPVGVIRAGLGAEREKDASGGAPNNVINLTYSCPVAEDCPAVLNAIIDSYKEFLDETYHIVGDDTVAQITRGRDALKTQLADKEKEYYDFRQKSPLIWKGKDGINVQQERVANIEAKRSALMIRRAGLDQRLKAIQEAIGQKRPRAEILALAAEQEEAEDGKPAAKPAEAPHSLEDQLVALQLQEQQLLEDYGEDHPQVRSVHKRIELLRDFLNHQNGVGGPTVLGLGGDDKPADPVDAAVQKLRGELGQTESLLRSLTDLLAQEQKAARELNTFESQDEHFQEDIKQTREVIAAVVKRLDEMSMARDAGGFDARPVSRPAAGGRTAPSLFYILASGLLLGTLAGAGLGYLAELSDKGFRTADEIRRRLGLAVIGHIPQLAPDEGAKAAVESGALALDPFLCTHYRPKSVDAEAYRAVRTALFFNAQGGGHNLIQVTSPDMGDGKSTLIANLAVCIAQSGKKVILVDADLRRPRIHKMLGLPSAAAGLATVIAGQDAVGDAVQQTVVPGLDVLPCGPLPPNPAELLTSPRLKELLDDLRGRYDFVLVDTPPLLAVTDPCAVAPRVDGVVLALRISKKSRPKAERAREILSTLGVKVLGVVVNGVTRGKGAARYGADPYDYTYGPDDYTGAEEEPAGGYYHDEAGEDKPADAAAAEPAPKDPPPEAPRPVKSGRGRGGRQGVWRLPLLAWLFGLWA
jgi:capsular exopolysaccharide synthesis family protein